MRPSMKNVLLRGLAVMAVAAPLLFGCNNSSPTEPKLVAATPTPGLTSGSVWALTSQVTAAAGPSAAFRPANARFKSSMSRRSQRS